MVHMHHDHLTYPFLTNYQGNYEITHQVTEPARNM
jgi:hypothetical protein